MSTAWIMLLVAGLLEVCWAIGLKSSQGFTKLYPSIFTAVTMLLSMYFLAKAVETLPIGTAYAVWVGIGAFGAAIMGIVLLNEPASPLRLAFLALLLVSIIGLKLTAGKV